LILIFLNLILKLSLIIQELLLSVSASNSKIDTANIDKLKKTRWWRKRKNKIHTINTNLINKYHYNKNKKAFRTLFLVSSSLIIFWTPFIISWPIYTYCPSCMRRNFYLFAYWMKYFFSFSNSIILIFGNLSFRTKLFQIFHRKK
jgi:hypothetical protein